MHDTDISKDNFKTEFKTAAMQVPVIFHTGGTMHISAEYFAQFEEAATKEHLFRHIAVLNDIHGRKKSLVPAETVTASQSHILPKFLDAAPNCGMRLLMTDLQESEMTTENIKALLKKIQKNIPTGSYLQKPLSSKITSDILSRGSQAAVEHFSSTIENEIENTFGNGNMAGAPIEYSRLKEAVPALIRFIARFRLSILGATNSHFIYLVKIKDVLSPEIAQKIGLRENQYGMLLHTGSSIVGRYLASFYSPTQMRGIINKIIASIARFFSAKKLKQSISEATKDGNTQYDGKSEIGRIYKTAMDAACNYGFANRTIISGKINSSLAQVFKRKVSTSLLYDSPHVFIQQEKHFREDIWIHRNGAARALGPDQMKSHPLFSLTGEPALIAPLGTSLGYIGAGTDDNSSTYFSANHEMGSLKELNLGNEVTNKLAFTEYGHNYNQNVFFNQNHQDYAEKIIHEISENKIAKMVASFEPIAKITH